MIHPLPQLISSSDSLNQYNNIAHIDKLTIREFKVLRLTMIELSCKEIAEQLNISPETVKKHRKNILKKLQINGKSGFRRLLFNLSLASRQ
ncbi:DNA-binding CsgD family transcriptional regulator [Spirosoma lacussanchae]|uniref:response regulator transcription factor n=1 Tax=Spirosoma lacussanchae TaxID=1884249 RepID=UPI001107AAF3|nr:helix-turn-helix transcriptional regulator [Spirosoma lacussanchae]